MNNVKIGAILFLLFLGTADVFAGPNDVEAEYRNTLRLLDRRIADILHNLSSASIPGHKQRFHEEPSFPDLNGEGEPDLIRIDMQPGTIKKTGRPLDLAIEGNGFFSFTDGKTGEIVYTRSGSLETTPGGNLCLVSGNSVRLLDPQICLREETVSVFVNESGQVQVSLEDNGKKQIVGTIQLATFVSPTRLKVLDERYFFETEFSGPPTLRSAGFDGAGVIKSGCLEDSNVDVENALRELKRLLSVRKTLKEFFLD